MPSQDVGRPRFAVSTPFISLNLFSNLGLSQSFSKRIHWRDHITMSPFQVSEWTLEQLRALELQRGWGQVESRGPWGATWASFMSFPRLCELVKLSKSKLYDEQLVWLPLKLPKVLDLSVMEDFWCFWIPEDLRGLKSQPLCSIPGIRVPQCMAWAWPVGGLGLEEWGRKLYRVWEEKSFSSWTCTFLETGFGQALIPS